MSDEVTTSSDNTPPTPFPVLLGKAAMIVVWFGVMGLFGLLIDFEIALAQMILCAVVAIILGTMAACHRRADADARWYARRGIFGGGLLLIAVVFFGFVPVGGRRSASPRSSDSNSNKMIGIAIHSVHDSTGELPSAVYDPMGLNYPAGKGLSWRVGILPFMEQEPLYRQFDITEPWDSKTNQQAMQQIVPCIYQNHYEGNVTNTRWQAFVGPGTVFDPSVRLTLSNIPDGLENTAMLAEATHAVPWSSPYDLPYSQSGPLPALGHASQKRIMTLMADGTVRSVGKKVSPAIWHAVIQRADGARVNEDWWKD